MAYKVEVGNLNVSRPGVGIDVASPGDFIVVSSKGKIDGETFMDGDVKEVPRETAIRLGLEYDIINQNIPWFPPIRPFEVAVSVSNARTGAPVGALYDTIDGLIIVPLVPPPEWHAKSARQVNIGPIEEETRFRVRLWANQDADAKLEPSNY